jgi:hypothetical protein
MPRSLSRRDFLTHSTATAAFASPTVLSAPVRQGALQEPQSVHTRFPAQDDESVQAVVRFSHFNLKRVRELVDARPALAKASWDWGYGDWETALGAAAHTGNHAIAEYLIEHGARPTLFSATALGQLDVVRAYVEATPGIQGIAGPHGIPLLKHARLGGDRSLPVFEYLQAVGGADVHPNQHPYEGASRESFFGKYRFGPGSEDYFEAYDQRGTLMFRRGGRTGRGLTHVGANTFSPAGAPAVSISFDVEAGLPVRVTVHDPDPIVTAIREG